ncbi:MAG: prolyl oligopeptidase family serine peptidase [Betaproteobacteria bacterium]
MNKWKSGLMVAAVLLGGSFVSLPGQAQPATPAAAASGMPPLIPVNVFMRRAEYGSMSISPKGDRLAATVPFKGRDNLVVVDLTKKTRNIITSFEKDDVVAFNWVNNDRIFLRVADGRDALGRVTFRGNYAIDVDGSNMRDLSNLRGLAVLRTLKDDTAGEMLVRMTARARNTSDVYKLNTKTGKSELMSFVSPGETGGYVLDWDNVPRVAFTTDLDTTVSTVWYRESADAKWTELLKNPPDPAEDNIDPLGFDTDNKTLIVASNVGRDKYAIYKYDPVARKLGALVFEHPLIDVQGGIIWDRNNKRIAGIGYSADVNATKWFDPAMDSLQKQIDATLPGMTNRLSFPNDTASHRYLISSTSDTDPGRNYLYDGDKKTLEALPDHRPWLKPADISPRKYMPYTARDGLVIPAWVTIPKGTSGKNLPLVLNVHGGPNARVYTANPWGRYSEAPFFANRGYVVLEPEPRASTEFGRKHLSAGYKQWGLAMQDDLTDGIMALVKAGIVDKNKVCIYGGSYGGYASLEGIVKDPDLYKCSMPWIAVSDLLMLQTEMTSDSNNSRFNMDIFYNRNIGNRKTESDNLRKVSPVYNAKVIKTPVLLVAGSDDVRVPLKHGTDMKKALDEAGVKNELVVYTAEAHGFNKQENIEDFFTRAQNFFAEYLGGRK